MFSDELKAELNKPLDTANVRERPKGGVQLAYIEGWHVIAEANRVFGYDAWVRETIYCKEVSRIEYKDSANKDKIKVGYEAKVRISISNIAMGHIFREGTGHGSQVAQDLFDAIEGAAKEAETDAMKRAFMTFGNIFGLALYDKERRNVEDVRAVTEREERELKKIQAAEAFTEDYIENLHACQKKDEYTRYKNDEKKASARERIRQHYPYLSEKIAEIEKITIKRLGVNNEEEGISKTA